MICASAIKMVDVTGLTAPRPFARIEFRFCTQLCYGELSRPLHSQPMIVLVKIDAGPSPPRYGILCV